MEGISCRSKISSFQPQNQDKQPPQKENVPETATKPGQTATAAAKHPGKRHKTRTKSHATAKHPGKHPQNREEMHLHTKKGDRDVTFTAFS
jgi:hypothetical protein